MEAMHALVLGIVQGITEFLPISSSAHLILTPVFTGWRDQGVTFDLTVHIGTLLAVVIYFRRDIAVLAHDMLLSMRDRRHTGQSRLGWAIIMGTVPAGLAGLLLLDLIDDQLRSVWVIFATTLLFGLLLGAADFFGARRRPLSALGWKDVLLIGMAQALALIPGTSRSGATITAGLLLGLTREAASRFSFLLAIPITALAATATLVEAVQAQAAIDWPVFFVGGLTSFVTALLAIHYFLKWLNRFGMWPYVLYRLGLAAVIYYVLLS